MLYLITPVVITLRYITPGYSLSSFCLTFCTKQLHNKLELPQCVFEGREDKLTPINWKHYRKRGKEKVKSASGKLSISPEPFSVSVG